MKHLTTTQPATEPVTLAEMRAHMGITQVGDTARDAVITRRIVAAREFAENHIRQPLLQQTITAYAHEFPLCLTSDAIALLSPVVSITEIRYIDTSGISQVWAAENYLLSTADNSVVPAYGLSWPDAREQPESVQIEYVAGRASAAAVPQSVREAIMFIVSQWEVFQSSIEGVVRPFTIPNAAKELLNPFVDYRNILWDRR